MVTAGAMTSVAAALAHAERLAASHPRLALEQADEILRALPTHPQARLIRGAALRRLQRLPEARAELDALALAEPRSAAAAYELGLVCMATGDAEDAVEALRRAVALRPDMAGAWRALGESWQRLGCTAEADQAHLQGVRASTREPVLLEAGLSLVEGRLAEAEAQLRGWIADTPDDPAALRMLGECLVRQGRTEAAEIALRRALAIFPGFTAARELLARVLHLRQQPAAALAELAPLRADDPDAPSLAMLEGALLARTGRHPEAAATYRQVLARYPSQPRGWMSLGHVLKAIDRTEEAVDAYRTAIRQQPGLGEAWWSLANLKTFRFSPTDQADMRAALAAARDDEDRLHLHFALGKALEDAGSDEDAFRAYSAGAKIRRAQLVYDPDRMAATCAERTRILTAEAFRRAGEGGCPARDPIFVVGLPRSGSTLIEQILSSHSQIEGVAELPDLMTIAGRLGAAEEPARYVDRLCALSPDERRALGEDYLKRTRAQRREDKPFFIDKLPNNWMHVALIRLILPRAHVIDARRHPMACCWSAYTQHFARGQEYSYDLAELGRYYRDYVLAMEAVDAALPGFVHRVIHEHVVDDLERETRGMLAFLGLSFEPACLTYWRTDRVVRTPSAQQVRRPIFRDGAHRWRRFEPWLDPLVQALDDAVDRYTLPAGARAISADRS